MSSSSSSAAKALRESFGDRKPPDITRKITACVACRKLKIKCNMNGRNPPCTRCESRGLSCTVNKSLQMLLESDASWKENIERRLGDLESGMVSTNNPTPSPVTVTPEGRGRSRKTPASRASAGPPNMITLNLSCSLGAFPASSMIDLTFSGQQAMFQGQRRPDLISCGVISHQTAEALFTFYHNHLDPCVHYVLEPDDTLAKVRSRSSLLTSAICTVSAFCTGSNSYQSCLNALKTEVSRKMFATNHKFDDVRALCIGAFWLSEIASALSGLAVRIATELDLHRCITKMPHTKRACYDRTRLYFLVYLCDRHFSLSHGRPPLTRDFHSLKAPRDFLQSPFSTSDDLRLVSQVELWSISGRVFDKFGADIENPMASQKSTELESFGAEYDQWFGGWSELLSTSETATPFANRLGCLYYHSAKLFLLSHVFRGPAAEIYSLPKEGIDSFASSALKNALAIVRCIVDGHTDTEPWLHKLPLYFGTMTAFASVCLLKASCQEQSTTGLDFSETTEYIRRLVELLRTSLVADHPANTWSSIASSLDIATKGWDLFHLEDEHITTPADNAFDFDIFDGDGGLNLDPYSGA